jgi:hypothetical protein
MTLRHLVFGCLLTVLLQAAFASLVCAMEAETDPASPVGQRFFIKGRESEGMDVIKEFDKENNTGKGTKFLSFSLSEISIVAINKTAAWGKTGEKIDVGSEFLQDKGGRWKLTGFIDDGRYVLTDDKYVLQVSDLSEGFALAVGATLNATTIKIRGKGIKIAGYYPNGEDILLVSEDEKTYFKATVQPQKPEPITPECQLPPLPCELF